MDASLIKPGLNVTTMPDRVACTGNTTNAICA